MKITTKLRGVRPDRHLLCEAMNRSDPSASEALLEDCNWLRSLARSLVLDGNQAEDAAQDTWIAALQRDPRKGPVGRGWLARVLRNRLLQDHRAQGRRSFHESQARESGQSPSPEQIAKRIALQQRLLEAINTLDDPYRTALVMRFLDDLPPREIARQLERPVKTIDTWIARGLTRLRGSLDDEFGGDRRAWLSVLVPFLSPTKTPPVLGALGLAMNVKLVLSAIVIVASGALMIWFDDGDQAAPASLAKPVEVAKAANELVSPTKAKAPLDGRQVESAKSADEDAIATTAVDLVATNTTVVMLEGVTVDDRGRPVPNLVVVSEPTSGKSSTKDPVAATSDTNGHFTFPMPEDSIRLSVRDADFAALTKPFIYGSAIPSEPARITVARKRSYAGTILDGSGVPIPEVELRVVINAKKAPVLGISTLMAHVLFGSESRADGRFDLPEIPWTQGVQVECQKSGFEARVFDLPEHDAADLQIVMAARSLENGHVHGLVLGPDQTPLADVAVSAGEGVVHTDERGRFLLEFSDTSSKGPLFAIKPGFLPARHVLEGHEGQQAESPLILTLGDEPPPLRGRALDTDGEPLAGVIVSTHDVTPFGVTPRSIGETEFHVSTSVEAMLSGESSGLQQGCKTTTDEAGRFALACLPGKDYEVHGLHPETLQVTSGIGRAGEGELVLRFPPAELTRVRGRVTSLDGSPLRGLTVKPARNFERADGSVQGLLGQLRVKTDETGHFDLGALDTRDLNLLVFGPGLAWTQDIPLEDRDDIENMELVFPAEARLRIACEFPIQDGTRAHLENARGEKLEFIVKLGEVSVQIESTLITNAAPVTIVSDEHAHWVVLKAAHGAELARERVKPAPEETVDVTFR